MKSVTLPLVSVIILNWNRIDDTLKCLEYIRKQTYKNFEIVVVDNGSSDNSKKMLRTIADIKFVDNPINRGFTGGHIDGLKSAGGEFIFVLNNDAVVHPKYLELALNSILGNEKIAAVGGRSYAWNNEKDILSEDVPYFTYQNIDPVTAEGIFSLSDGGYEHEVPWVSGSAMVLRRSAIDEVGYFYDPMFAYYEETDLFARLMANNYSIVYNPALKIWHKNGSSSSAYFQLNQLFKNRFVFATRNLQSKELTRFLSSHSKFLVRGSAKHLLKRGNTEEDTVLNKATFDAAVQSLRTWPKWLLSKQGLKGHDSQGRTYVEKLKAYQIEVSFVVCISNVNEINNIAEFITSVSYKHYNSEFIVVCSDDLSIMAEEKLKELKIDSYPVQIVASKAQIQVNTLNVGWLSCSKEYVWFMDPQDLPEIDGILETLYSMTNRPSVHMTGSMETSAKTKFVVSFNKNVCISRNILSAYGGLDTKDTTQSLANLLAYAQLSREFVCSSKTSSLKEPAIQPKTHTIDSGTLKKIQLLDSQRIIQKRKLNSYSKLLNRYYRLYQAHNLSMFLITPGIGSRVKLGRIRNTTLAFVKLNRKKLALELKHMNNEVVKTKNVGFDEDIQRTQFSKQATQALENNVWQNTPVFIICRDRVSPLKELIGWLENIGMHNIVLIDNDSLYPNLVSYLNKTPYQVIYTRKNIGHTVVWSEGIAKSLFPEQYYIVTDPDVIPDEGCPEDVITYFYKLHKKYIDYHKIGFGLQIDDLPDHYKLKNHVIEWESQFWSSPLETGVYEAGVDTTFALYKPHTDFYTLHPSIRTGRPYTARHLPWYVNSTDVDEEEAFYRLHASQDITSWNTDEILERYKKELDI